jgi:trans-2,3-dihydro-3-hydroxyanthranilate isomerase
MKFEFLTCDVFTERPFSGNPLAVFPRAEGLDTDAMQAIAREFNISETTFVLPRESAQADFHVRIFTPAQELPFAGHPTIGTALALAWTGAARLGEGASTIVLEEEAGLVPVTVRKLGGRPVDAELSVPALPTRENNAPSLSAVAAALSLAPDEILAGDDRLEAWVCGTACLCVPVESIESVGRARPDLSVWKDALSDTSATGAYVFAYGGQRTDSDIHARFFAPDLGIPEDPATGAAASAMGGYLGSRCSDEDGTRSWIIEQGIEMGRPSEVHLTVERRQGVVSAVSVGGRAVRICEGSIDIEIVCV